MGNRRKWKGEGGSRERFGRNSTQRRGRGRNWELQQVLKSHEPEGGKKEPTREGCRAEPVERRGPEAATQPQALQSGIVGCPPTQGSQQRVEGRQGGETPGKESPPPVAQGHMENAEDTASNKTKQNKNRKKMKISWCSVSGIWPHTGGRGKGIRQK